MTQELDLGVSELSHLLCFRQHRIRCTAALFAPRERDHAIGAELVTALDNRDVTPVRVRTRGKFGLKAFIGITVVEAGDPLLPCLDLYQHLRQIAVRCGATYQ